MSLLIYIHIYILECSRRYPSTIVVLRDMTFRRHCRKFGLFSFPRQGQETLQGRGAFGKASFDRRGGKAVVFTILERSGEPLEAMLSAKKPKMESMGTKLGPRVAQEIPS